MNYQEEEEEAVCTVDECTEFTLKVKTETAADAFTQRRWLLLLGIFLRNES